jgi:hypothetical protein
MSVTLNYLKLGEREIPWSDIDDLHVDDDGISTLLSTGERYEYPFEAAPLRDRARVAQSMRERVMASIVVSAATPEGALVALRRNASGEIFTRISLTGEISEAGRRGAEALALRLAESAGLSTLPLHWAAPPASFSARPVLG